MKRLLVGGIAAVAIGLGAPVAGADGYTAPTWTSSPVSPSRANHGDPDRLIKTGHVVCELLDDGKQTITAAIMIKHENDSKYPEFDATLFAQAASWSYCPEHTNEFGNI
jgi:hypothetical protein